MQQNQQQSQFHQSQPKQIFQLESLIRKASENKWQIKLKRYEFGWKFFIFLVLNFYIFSGALAFGFQQYYQFNRTTLLSLNILFILILVLDVVYDAMSAPQISQSQIQLIIFKSYRKKAKRYTKFAKYYLIDRMIAWDILVLITFCIHYIPDYTVGRYFGLIIILKLSNMISYNNQIYKRLHAKPIARSVYTIAKIIYLMALLTHYLGIFFYVIDQTLIDNQYFGTIAQNPATYYQGMSLCFSPIQNQSLFQRYIWAAYYSSSLISTIAYGDIVPKNYFQNIYVCFLMIISTLFIALLLEQFMILIRQQKFGEYQFITKFNCLKQLMNEKLVPIQIQNSVRSYLVYLQYQKKLKNQKPVMMTLTKKLQKQILYYGYLNLYQQKINFFGFKSSSMLFQIGLLLEEVLCQAQCVMLNPFLNNKSIQDDEQFQNHELEFHDPSLYFLYEGKIQQFTKYDSDSKQFNFFVYDSKKDEHKSINMFQFITGTQLRYGIRTLQLTKLVKFTKKEFIGFIQKYDQIFKYFKSLKQKALCSQINLEDIDENCFICDNNDHSFKQCPSCHYTLNQNVKCSIKLSQLLKTQKFYNNRAVKDRKIVKSKKIRNIVHRSAIWGKLKLKHTNFSFDLLLNKTTKQLLNIDTQSKSIAQDSKYDSMGIDSGFNI